MTEDAIRWFNRSMFLILAGLVAALLSLFGLHHPLGFLFFMTLGFTPISAGVLIFVYYLIASVRPAGSESSD